MCKYLSFVIVPTNGGLKYYADDDLDSHSEAIRRYGLTGQPHYEAEWDDGNVLEIRIPDTESESVRELLAATVRKEFRDRQALARRLIIDILTEGRVPAALDYLEHPRWDAKAQRIFACWCVRNTPLADGRKVWDLLTDERSRSAVDVAERYANGHANDEELAAARAAAWDARNAARDAARDAAWDAQAKHLLALLRGEEEQPF